MRTGFTQAFLNACYHAQTDGAVIALLVEITHPGLATSLKYTNQIKPVTSNGKTYQPRSMEISLPSELVEQVSQFTLTLDNADLEPALTVYPLDTRYPCTVILSLINKAEPNTIAFGPCSYLASEDAHNSDTSVFSGTLDSGLNELWPAHAFTPSSHRGLFGATS